MKRPYIDILVDGVMQRREAYFEHETIDLGPARPYWDELARLRPVLGDNECLRETVGGYMEIVTFPKTL